MKDLIIDKYLLERAGQILTITDTVYESNEFRPTDQTKFSLYESFVYGALTVYIGFCRMAAANVYGKIGIKDQYNEEEIDFILDNLVPIALIYSRFTGSPKYALSAANTMFAFFVKRLMNDEELEKLTSKLDKTEDDYHLADDIEREITVGMDGNETTIKGTVSKILDGVMRITHDLLTEAYEANRTDIETDKSLIN